MLKLLYESEIHRLIELNFSVLKYTLKKQSDLGSGEKNIDDDFLEAIDSL